MLVNLSSIWFLIATVLSKISTPNKVFNRIIKRVISSIRIGILINIIKVEEIGGNDIVGKLFIDDSKFP